MARRADQAVSDRLEADVSAGWRLRFDGCTDGDLAAPYDDAHDARSADQPAIGASIEDAIEQPVLEVLDLPAPIAQTRHSDEHVVAQSQHRPGRQREQVNASGRDVLAQGTRRHGEPGRSEVVEQLTLQQVDLPQVGLSRIRGDAAACRTVAPKCASP